jgi:epoxyqueuosine reductase
MTNQNLTMPYQIAPNYQRMHQKNLLFARLEWDERLNGLYQGLGPLPRSLDQISKKKTGYGLMDYALLSAGRYVDGFNDTVSSATQGRFDLFSSRCSAIRGRSLAHESWKEDTRLQAARQELREQYDPAALTTVVKKAARFLGADLVGIAPYDPRWVYSHLYRVRDPDDESGWSNSRRARPGDFPQDDHTQEVGLEMPEARSVVVLAFEEDYSAINTSPAFTNGGAVGLAYSRMAFTASSLAEFMWVVGYWARAAGNDIGLSIPFAVMAGMGELARNGQLITKEYGPRVRLAKVFTSMELIPDGPDLFGVWEYCTTCKKCAEHCPSHAIPLGEPTWEGPNRSNNPGVLKWYVNAEQCSRYLKANGGECSTCHSRCPYNKDYSHWYHRLFRDIAPRLGRGFAAFALWLDDVLGYGVEAPGDRWWGIRP